MQQQQGGIPVVQGEPVTTSWNGPPSNTPYGNMQASQPSSGAASPGGDGGVFNGHKGEVQPKQYKDVAFAIAFYLHLGFLVVLLVFALQVDASNQSEYTYGGTLFCVSVCALVAAGLSSLSLGLMMQFAEQLVKMALIFSVAMSGLVFIMGLMSGAILMAVMGGIGFALGCCYAYAVWNRIPFAAANLKTGLSGVRANGGLSLVAYFTLGLAFVWSLMWTIATGGAMASMGSMVIFFSLLSYYWTHEVLKNTLHVISTGVIGTWWFVPGEASTFWSTGLTDSIVRATTFSFGSICFGSLLVAIIAALRHMRHYLQDNENFGILICIVDCILGCIQSIIEYINKWAYVYVGLYGYSYLEAGKNVMTLFQNKGWTTIITDNLVENVLFMVSMGIGLVTGLVGLILASMDDNLFSGLGIDDGNMVGFVIGLLVGYVMASVHLSVVGSAVNTVIVCYAEAPAEFQQNHPQLSTEMREAWQQAWPNEFRSGGW